MVDLLNRLRRRIAVSLVLGLALVLSLAPRLARADNSSAQLQSQANGMAQRVEQTSQEYQAAAAEVQQLEEQIAQNEERTADIEARLPEQRERTAASIKNLYIFQQSSPGLIDLILSSDTFGDFISTLRYIDVIQERNATEVQALVDMESELVKTQAELSAQRDAARVKEEEAKTALEEARAVRAELQAQADAAALAEASDRVAAIAQVQQKVSSSSSQDSSKSNEDASSESSASNKDETSSSEQSNTTFTTKSGNTATVEVAPEASASTAPIVENTTTSEVDSWASRIDAYLAGSPLAGYGSVFAQAASDYGVDPRISPAISCVESGKGSVCFLPHNAWGWGSASWSDWPSAIRGHVSGYASIYGSTITLEGAKMYASNDIYAEWYSTVLSEMSRI